MTNAAADPGRHGAAFTWLGVERAWTRTRGDPAVIIGIVDEGVAAGHPLLAPNIRRDHARRPAAEGSDETVGTWAAGIAAGCESEAHGFAGVAPHSRILPVRFTTGGGAFTLDLAHAIEYAVEMGACVVHVPHAADVSEAGVLRAIRYAASRNALVVCSALGPRERAVTDDMAPNLVCVLPIDNCAQPLPAGFTGVAHLAAPAFARVPGVDSDGVREVADPSVAAAYVAGCAALVKSLNPAWGYHDIREHLLASAKPVAELAGRCQAGGALDVAQAVLGPIELDGARRFTVSALDDLEIRWTLRYRSASCANVVALFRAHGSEHWRELANTRARELRIVIPADSLRPSSGTLRLSSRDSNIRADDIHLTIV